MSSPRHHNDATHLSFARTQTPAPRRAQSSNEERHSRDTRALAGKGEPIRLLCAYAGLDLEDYRFANRAGETICRAL